MCGIAGAFDPSGNPAEDCRRQLEVLLHRGPDAIGVHDGGQAAVGQTRLAVIDLLTGDPPIATPDGAVGVAHNGEIYNYRALRADLRRRGHTFRTQGDTEVLAHLLEEQEPVAAAAALEGMFAFAAWDARRAQLILVRDKLGKKPLYYWREGNRLVFGSEIKAVLTHPAVTRRLRVEALAPYLGLGYVPTPDTFFEGVRSVPPGHVLTFDGDHLELQPYWEPPTVGVDGGRRIDVGFREATALVRAELEAAVERRLVGDVPIGAFLSGGVDSSAVVALMVRAGAGQVRTFTMGFDDQDGFDEREPARATARALGTQHEEFLVRPDVTEVAERLVWHHDQPFGDSSALPFYLLSQETAKHVTVALTGDGGDEAFAGYERFAAAALFDRYRRLPSGLRAAARPLGRLRTSNPKHPLRKVQRFVAAPSDDVLATYLSWLAPVDLATREALFPGAGAAARTADQPIWDRTAGAALADRLLDLNLRTYLLDDLLPKSDRMSMAHSLEVRSPLLDPRVVELALRLPPQHRLRRFERKRVLRAAVADLVPAHVLSGPKRGFAVPLDRWFRGELAPWLTGLLGPGARSRQHLDGAAIDGLLAGQVAGHHHGQALWSLATFELFLRAQGW